MFHTFSKKRYTRTGERFGRGVSYSGVSAFPVFSVCLLGYLVFGEWDSVYFSGVAEVWVLLVKRTLWDFCLGFLPPVHPLLTGFFLHGPGRGESCSDKFSDLFRLLHYVVVLRKPMNQKQTHYFPLTSRFFFCPQIYLLSFLGTQCTTF